MYFFHGPNRTNRKGNMITPETESTEVDTLKIALGNKKKICVLFYSPKCGYCMKMANEWNDFAKENSQWRDVLEYFSTSTQVGLTATPKETKNISSSNYFGEPVYSYSLKEQATIALELWEQLKVFKVTLLAHDYGTSIATEILARHNANEINLQIDQLILCNGSMHIELSQLRTIQKLLKGRFGKYVAKLTNYVIFSKNLRNVYFDKTKITKEELQQMWQQIEYNKGKKVIHLVSDYINQRYTHWDRWIGALKETQITTKIIWAKEDPVAVKAIAELLASEITNNKLHWINNCGHFPMLESPKKWTELVLK